MCTYFLKMVKQLQLCKQLANVLQGELKRSLIYSYTREEHHIVEHVYNGSLLYNKTTRNLRSVVGISQHATFFLILYSETLIKGCPKSSQLLFNSQTKWIFYFNLQSLYKGTKCPIFGCCSEVSFH